MTDPKDFDVEDYLEAMEEEELIQDIVQSCTEEIAKKEEEMLVQYWEEGFDYAHEYMPDFTLDVPMTFAILPSDNERPPPAPEGYRHQQTFVLKDLTEDEVQEYYYDRRATDS